MKESVRIKANAFKGINEISMKGEIVVFGSTYMAQFPFYELINRCGLENAVYNRSIEGMTLAEASELLQDCVIQLRPDKLFLALGEEDVHNPDALTQYSALLDRIRAQLSSTRLYVIGVHHQVCGAEDFNEKLNCLCDEKNITFIRLVTQAASAMALYKARFKQLSCFFRRQPLGIGDAFAMAGL